jgi:gamma-butyrobetaine dioxygenase
VAAKQYLCHADRDYFDQLSPASVTSLKVQGGIFDAEAAAAFIAQPYAEQAVRLRRWDDGAKDPEAKTPDLAHFRPLVEAQMRAG